jgi:carbonic anhydrase/acetyltransferase-like protein (isoleucine patch superfamily)
MGVPARVKRQLTDEEVADLDVFWKNYVEYTRVYREEYGIAEGEAARSQCYTGRPQS